MADLAALTKSRKEIKLGPRPGPKELVSVERIRAFHPSL